MPLTHRFLLAKHWHIFLLTFVIPFLLQLGVMLTWAVNFAQQVITQPEPELTGMFSIFKFFPVLMIVYSAAHFFWLWSLAIGLQPKVPANVVLKVNKFKGFFFFQITYLMLFSIGISVLISGVPDLIKNAEAPNININLIGIAFAVVFPLHFFAMFSVLYCMYFAARTIKTVELQREVSFGEFIGELILIWFHAIGVWFIQPQVNKLMEDKPKEIV